MAERAYIDGGKATGKTSELFTEDKGTPPEPKPPAEKNYMAPGPTHDDPQTSYEDTKVTEGYGTTTTHYGVKQKEVAKGEAYHGSPLYPLGYSRGVLGKPVIREKKDRGKKP